MPARQLGRNDRRQIFWHGDELDPEKITDRKLTSPPDGTVNLRAAS